MVFHNLWKEKMAVFEKKAKKVRKYKRFFKCIVENHVGSVDKNTDIFPHKSVEKKKRMEFPFLVLREIIRWKSDHIF
jgi:hypothetical protein